MINKVIHEVQIEITESELRELLKVCSENHGLASIKITDAPPGVAIEDRGKRITFIFRCHTGKEK